MIKEQEWKPEQRRQPATPAPFLPTPMRQEERRRSNPYQTYHADRHDMPRGQNQEGGDSTNPFHLQHRRITFENEGNSLKKLIGTPVFIKTDLLVFSYEK